MTRSVEDYIANLQPAQAAVVRALCEVIRRAAPEARESIKWAQPVYEHNGPFAFMKKATAHVTFGFWRGYELDGGRGVLESSGTRMAHMKLRDAHEIDERLITSLVKSAVKLNDTKGDPTKRARSSSA